MYKHENPVVHVQRMHAQYETAIKYSIMYTQWLRTQDITETAPDIPELVKAHTKIQLLDLTTDSAIFYAQQNGLADNNSTVLNFASSTHPGGGYLTGAMAQEEAICGVSTLYNVLSTFENSVYQAQRRETFNGLYKQSILYSPAIVFENIDNNNICYADVITCAAPNRHSALLHGVEDELVKRTMYCRIDQILHSAAILGKRKCLILGAYGCGVFGNDPIFVAEVFKELLFTKYADVFENVLFAIPNKGKGTNNYIAFKNVLFK